MRALALSLLSVALVASPAHAQNIDRALSFARSVAPSPNPWRIDFRQGGAYGATETSARLSLPLRSPLHPAIDFRQGNPQPLHAAAVEHSEAYQKHDSHYQVDGLHTSGRATRNMDRQVIRRDGESVVVDLHRWVQSDKDLAGWAAATITL